MPLDTRRTNIIILLSLTIIFFVGCYFIVSQEIVNIENTVITESSERSKSIKAKFVLIQSFIKTLRDNMQQDISWQSNTEQIHSALESFDDYADLGVTIIAKEKLIDKTNHWYDVAGVLIAKGKKSDLSLGVKQEISAALHMQSIFINAINTIPDIKWTYYISTNDFIYYFPYHDPELITIVIDQRHKEYWIKAMPENNPEKRMVMTNVYADTGGKGNLVTFSMPIYLQNQMAGIIAIDMSLSSIDELIASELLIGDSFLLDEQNSVLSSISIPAGDTLYGPEQITEDNSIHIHGDGYDYISYEIIANELKFIHRFSQISKVKTAFANSLREMILLLISVVMAYMIYYSRILVIRVETLANTDPLTSLLNRRAMEKAVIPLLSLNERYEQNLCFLLADIDYFKNVNDTYGHAVGDDVLTNLTSILKSCLRGSDLLSRHGGEEFLIVLPQTDLESGFLLSERIRTSIENTRTGDHRVAVTISIGCVEIQPDENFDSAITRADKMLYLAKSNGRNQTVSKENV